MVVKKIAITLTIIASIPFLLLCVLGIVILAASVVNPLDTTAQDTLFIVAFIAVSGVIGGVLFSGAWGLRDDSCIGNVCIPKQSETLVYTLLLFLALACIFAQAWGVYALTQNIFSISDARTVPVPNLE